MAILFIWCRGNLYFNEITNTHIICNSLTRIPAIYNNADAVFHELVDCYKLELIIFMFSILSLKFELY